MTTILTLGGANFGLSDTVGRALAGYATSGQRVRRKVAYPQAWSAKSMRAGISGLDLAARDELTAGNEFEIIAGSQGAECVGLWLEQIAGRPDAPTPQQLRRITLLGNPCRRLGGVVTSGTFFTKHGFLGRRRPTPETQYPTVDIARKNDGWANADGWWEPATDKPSKSRLQLGRIVDHSRYDAVDLGACKVRAISGNTRYLVAP